MLGNYYLLENCGNLDIPSFANSFKRSVHSSLNRFAPVREPSPPMTTKFAIPRRTKFLAARLRPARSLNSLQRADPITVPPWKYTAKIIIYSRKCKNFLLSWLKNKIISKQWRKKIHLILVNRVNKIWSFK